MPDSSADQQYHDERLLGYRRSLTFLKTADEALSDACHQMAALVHQDDELYRSLLQRSADVTNLRAHISREIIEAT